jgi:ribosome-interacting GTPase 1
MVSLRWVIAGSSRRSSSCPSRDPVPGSVHQDVARTLKFARLWGGGAVDGQRVGPEHCVADGDIVELHPR